MLMSTPLVLAELPEPFSAEVPQTILWPRQVLASVGGSTPEENPQRVLGEPNGTTQLLLPGASATFREFRGDPHPALTELLGAGKVKHGDLVSLYDLARSDVIAFARNGTAPAAGGGWESCDWTFADGVTTLSVRWD